MNGQQLVDGFDFHNEGVFNKEINDVSLCDLYSLVFKRQDDLAVIRNPSEFQFVAQARVITGFQQARTEMAMYLDCCPDGFVANWIGGMLDESHVASLKIATSESLVEIHHHCHASVVFQTRVREVLR